MQPDMSFRLTAEQLDRFDREGYLVVEDLFAPQDLEPVIDEIGREIDRRAREMVACGKLSRAYGEYGFEHRLARISAESDSVALSVWNGNLAGPAIFDLIRNTKLLDVAEQLCGPEIIASSVYRLRPKIPHYDYGAVPWHQDSGYTEPYCDSALMVTVWLPLVDATEENGCLWVLPGVHKGDVLTHRTHAARKYLEIPPEILPPCEPVCVPVRKGGVLLLTNRTPHASFENTTDIVRWSMDLRYQSAQLPTNATISRLPNEVTAGNGVPPACYPPEADFLVRSRQRPQEVVTDAEVFRAIRENHLRQPVTSRWR
jgi:ectoine hydroxylase-related dioxygenase (phytanoyl-CoA dioxygenase family)